MMLHTFGQQAFAASLPPARESGTATLCLHARTKTMLAFARSFRCLIGAFHLLTVSVDGKVEITLPLSTTVIDARAASAWSRSSAFEPNAATRFDGQNRELPLPAFSMINPQ